MVPRIIIMIYIFVCFNKGDLILRTDEHVIEFVTKLCEVINKDNKNPTFTRIINKRPEEYL